MPCPGDLEYKVMYAVPGRSRIQRYVCRGSTVSNIIRNTQCVDVYKISLIVVDVHRFNHLTSIKNSYIFSTLFALLGLYVYTLYILFYTSLRRWISQELKDTTVLTTLFVLDQTLPKPFPSRTHYIDRRHFVDLHCLYLHSHHSYRCYLIKYKPVLKACTMCCQYIVNVNLQF